MSLPRPSLNVLIVRFFLPALAGLLLVLAYPPFTSGQWAWVALVPLLAALENCPTGEAFRRGYLAGLVFFGGTVWWVGHVTLAGTVVLIAFLALYLGLAGAWFARLLKLAPADSAARNLLVAILAAAGWVTIEWIRAQLLLGGFPWNQLGVSQHRAVPLSQVATITGVYGVSALLCIVNFTFYFTGRRFVRSLRQRLPIRRLSWEFYVAMFLVAGSFLFGMDQVKRVPPADTVRLSLVQANIPQTLKWEPGQARMIIDRYDRLSREWAIPYRPDLVVWPETATPNAIRYDAASMTLVTNISALAGVPLLTGSFDYTPYSDPPEGFNAAVLVQPDGAIGPIYRKIHLVPFGEYVPWARWLPFMKKLTPISFSMARGTEPVVYELARGRRPETVAEDDGEGVRVRLSAADDPSVAGRGGGGFAPVRFGVVICFEDTVAELFRPYLDSGVDFMVNLTNDGWFRESPAAEMHLANAVFRAIETRRPLVRATNHGITAVIDQFGFVRSRLEPFTEGCLNVELPLPDTATVTPYVRRGDLFVAQCAVVTIITLAVLVILRKRRPPADPPVPSSCP